MGDINIPQAEQEAILALDKKELHRLVERSMQVGHTMELRQYLWNCGPHILSRLHTFDQALARDREARSPRKREETQYDLHRATSALSHAIDGMQRRVVEERKDRERFMIEDLIWPPIFLGPELSVRVAYSWRPTIDDQWQHGSITFTHEVDLRPDYTRPAPKRKPSKAEQERELKARLQQTWEQLKRDALWSVRAFFKEDGDGGKIPKTFRVRADSQTGVLNNLSTQFWR